MPRMKQPETDRYPTGITTRRRSDGQIALRIWFMDAHGKQQFETAVAFTPGRRKVRDEAIQTALALRAQRQREVV